jgi:acetyl-CoA carboxylase carboxyl transferase subunit alpha
VALEEMLAALEKMKPDAIIHERRQKFLDIGSKGLAA